MKKLMIMLAVFALIVGAKVTGAHALTIKPPQALADPHAYSMKLSGVTVSADITGLQPDDAVYGGYFTDNTDWDGDGTLDGARIDSLLTDGSGNYFETWGVFQVSRIEDSLGGTRWSESEAHDEDLYVMFYGMYDIAIVGPDGDGQFDITSAGGFWQMYESADTDDSDEYTLLGDGTLGGGVAQRGNAAVGGDLTKFDSISNVGNTLMLSGVMSNGITSDPLVTVDQDADNGTAPSTGDGSTYWDITGGAAYAVNMFDTNAMIPGGDSFGNYHDMFVEFDFQNPDNLNPSGDLTDAGYSLWINDPIIGQIKPIPEPTTVALLGIGLVGMAGVAARRKLRKKTVEKS